MAPPNKTQIPNPFKTYSTHIYPQTIKDVFTWGEYLWERNAIYRNAIKKVVSYFISGVTVEQLDPDAGTDSAAVSEFQDLVLDRYNLLTVLQRFGEELAAMGNVFVSVERIFTRELLCQTPGCHFQMHLKGLQKGRDYEWDGKNVVATCPRCGKKGKWTMHDSRSQSSDGRKIRIIFRPAEDMRVQYNRLSDTSSYLYKLPQDIASAIRRGDSIYLEDTPKIFIDAALSNESYVRLPDDTLLSMRINPLSSLDRDYKGWGIPLFMVAFDDIVRMQHMDKFNEAVIMDYLVPTRVISPSPQNLKAGIDDPNRMPMSGSQFREFMSGAIKGRMMNPSQWIVSPVPVQYQQVGGDKSIIASDLLEWETSQLLAATGVPQEFRKTDMQTVAPTMGLRMFERQWLPYSRCLGTFVSWVTQHIARAHKFEGMRCSLDKTSFVEDDMNKQIMLNLMQGGVVAKTPVLKRFGVDFESDLKQRLREQQLEMAAAADQQSEQEGMQMAQSVIPPAAQAGMAAAQMSLQQAAGGGEGGGEGGAPAGGAMPPGGGGAPAGTPGGDPSGNPASIEQLYQEAQGIAQEIYNAPPNVRISQLTNLKATNPPLHAQVKQILADMESQVASQAVAQSKQPQG